MITAEILRDILDYDSETGVFRWRIQPSNRAYPGQVAGCMDDQGYWVILYKRKCYKAHRLAWLYMTGEWPKHCIDHIDGGRSNNSFRNLREATNRQNIQNQKTRSDSRTGYKGVCERNWNAVNRFTASININGERKHLGVFATAQEAHSAYVEAAKMGFGDFARAA